MQNSPCDLDVGFEGFVLAFSVGIITHNRVTFDERNIVIFHQLSFCRGGQRKMKCFHVQCPCTGRVLEVEVSRPLYVMT